MRCTRLHALNCAALRSRAMHHRHHPCTLCSAPVTTKHNGVPFNHMHTIMYRSRVWHTHAGAAKCIHSRHSTGPVCAVDTWVPTERARTCACMMIHRGQDNTRTWDRHRMPVGQGQQKKQLAASWWPRSPQPGLCATRCCMFQSWLYTPRDSQAVQ